MTAVLILGFLIGMRHALDADHVAAVASLVVSAKSVRRSVWQGAVWGMGHTLTLFAIGACAVLSGSALSPLVSSLLEGAVGLMLIYLGLDVARTIVRDRIHFHAHVHEDGVRHFHAHRHDAGSIASHDETDHGHEHLQPFPRRALLIGLMHGIAGSAALLLVTLDGSKSAWEGLAYILVFGAGSIVGMAVLSLVIAVPLAHADDRSAKHRRLARYAVSAANLAFGGFLVFTVLNSWSSR